MVEYQEITNTKDRVLNFPYRFVALPRISPEPTNPHEYAQWLKDNYWIQNYQVLAEDKPEAVKLAIELDAVFRRNPDDSAVNVILGRLKELRAKDRNQFTALDTWTNDAKQLVNFAGEQEVWESIMTRLGGYKGVVLEAMSGHHSYYPQEVAGRTIIALDYCRESLEKYNVPTQRRVLCDLNQIRSGVQFPFFNEGELDVISICFGFRYPIHIVPLLTEFKRILKPGGALSFIENPGSGYPEYCRRSSDPNRIVSVLKRCGFKCVMCQKLDIPSYWNGDRHDYHHIEAEK